MVVGWTVSKKKVGSSNMEVHDSCFSAIKFHREHPNDPSVTKNSETLEQSCSNVAQCNWVGYGARFACVSSFANATVPINVYGMPVKGGSAARIEKP